MSEKLNNEIYVLSCCLKDENVLLEVSSELSSRDFQSPANQLVFESCVELLNNDFKIDIMSVYNKIGDGIDDVGGIKYISRVFNLPVSKDNVLKYVKEVKNQSIKNQLLNKLDEVKDKLPELNTDPVEFCYGEILDVANSNEFGDNAENMGDGLEFLLEERAKLDGELPGLLTGFPSLDESILGLQPGRAVIVAARAKAGKSALLMSISKNIAIGDGKPVLYIDTELPTDFQRLRLVSMVSGVEEKKLATGRWINNKQEIKAVSKAVKEIKKAHLYHQYVPSFSSESILALTRKYKVKKDIQLMVFDYIKLPDSDSLKHAQEHQHLGNLANVLKNKIAGSLKIPVLSACQLNRTAVGVDKNDESQIGGSDKLSHFCDTLVFLREKSDKEIYEENNRLGNMSMTIGVNREGVSHGKGINILFQKEVLSMKEVGLY